jgi:hypothetical protein
VVIPSYPGDPHYVFLLVKGPQGEPHEKYRLGRRNMLEMLCMVAKVAFPDTQHVVGYATEPGPVAGSSEDAIYMDVRNWTTDQQAKALGFQRQFGFLTELQRFGKTYHEYPACSGPDDASVRSDPIHRPRSMRNSLCPCGSGVKFKKCCLPRLRR